MFQRVNQVARIKKNGKRLFDIVLRRIIDGSQETRATLEISYNGGGFCTTLSTSQEYFSLTPDVAIRIVGPLYEKGRSGDVRKVRISYQINGESYSMERIKRIS